MVCPCVCVREREREWIVIERQYPRLFDASHCGDNDAVVVVVVDNDDDDDDVDILESLIRYISKTERYQVDPNLTCVRSIKALTICRPIPRDAPWTTNTASGSLFRLNPSASSDDACPKSISLYTGSPLNVGGAGGSKALAAVVANNRNDGTTESDEPLPTALTAPMPGDVMEAGAKSPTLPFKARKANAAQVWWIPIMV